MSNVLLLLHPFMAEHMLNEARALGKPESSNASLLPTQRLLGQQSTQVGLS